MNDNNSYTFTFPVSGFVEVTVDAPDSSVAESEAWNVINGMCFGDLENICIDEPDY